MTENIQDVIDQELQDLNHDGIDRRGFLKCMAWAGTGLVWTMSGGIPVSRAFAKGMGKDAHKGGDFSFVQISDSHMGFNKPANPDVVSDPAGGGGQDQWAGDASLSSCCTRATSAISRDRNSSTPSTRF